MSDDPQAAPEDRGRTCLPDAQLAAWAADPGPLPLLLPHLRRCPRCRARARQLRDEASFARHVASALAPDPAGQPLPDLADPPPPEIPGYTIVGELARGGQGVVYRAVQHETNRAAAVKTILRGHAASARDIARFEREVEIAASLSHPLIVPVFEARVLPDGRHVLAMPLIDGAPLSLWAAHAPAGLAGARDRVALVRDVANAVQYAHAQGVIHRDLKPGNIIVDHARVPRILDFGLARRGPDPEPLPPAPAPDDRSSRLWALTMHGVFQGTPAYAAPEQFDADHRTPDVRVDVYALGVILHELLTGLAPFADSGGVEDLARSKRTRALPPASVASRSLGLRGVNADLDAVIARATAVDRDRRYPSAQALADDLDAFLAGRAVSARTEPLYRARKLIRRRLVPIALLTAAFLTLAAFLLQSDAHNRRLRDEQARLRALLRQLALTGAAALARSDERLPAERLLWDQLKDAPPAADPWLAAQSAPDDQRPFLWSLLEIYAQRPCLAARSLPEGGDVVRFHDDALSMLDIRGRLQEFRLSDLAPLAPPRQLSPAARFTFILQPARPGPLLFALHDGQYRCFDADSGAQVGALPLDGLVGEPQGVLSPDGRSILLRARDGGVRGFRLPDLAERCSLPPDFSPSARPAFTPDSRVVLGLDRDASRFHAFSLDDGRPLPTPFLWKPDYNAVIGSTTGLLRTEFSPSGRALAVCFERGLLILDDSGALRAVGANRTVGQQLSARWSPSERWIVTWSNGDSVPKLLDARTLAVAAAFHGHDRLLRTVAFTPDERNLLTTDSAGVLRRWPLPGADWKTRLGPLCTHDHLAVNNAAFDPSGDLWAARNDGRLLRLSPPWTSAARVFPTPLANARGVDFLPPRPGQPLRVLLAGEDAALHILPVDSDAPALKLPLPKKLDIFSMHVSPDGRFIAAGAGDSSLRVWDARSNALLAEHAFNAGRIPSLCWAPDSSALIVSAGAGAVRVLDPATLHDLPSPPKAAQQVRAVIASPPDPARPGAYTLLTLGDEGIVRVYSAPEMTLRGASARAENDLFCAAFHPSGLFAAVGDRGGGVSIVDARSGAFLARFRAPPPVMTLAWTNDGRSLLVGGGELSLDLWDFQALADLVAANRPFWLPNP